MDTKFALERKSNYSVKSSITEYNLVMNGYSTVDDFRKLCPDDFPVQKANLLMCPCRYKIIVRQHDDFAHQRYLEPRLLLKEPYR